MKTVILCRHVVHRAGFWIYDVSNSAQSRDVCRVVCIYRYPARPRRGITPQFVEHVVRGAAGHLCGADAGDYPVTVVVVSDISEANARSQFTNEIISHNTLCTNPVSYRTIN